MNAGDFKNHENYMPQINSCLYQHLNPTSLWPLHEDMSWHNKSKFSISAIYTFHHDTHIAKVALVYVYTDQLILLLIIGSCFIHAWELE